jgi:hypothetical protein
MLSAYRNVPKEHGAINKLSAASGRCTSHSLPREQHTTVPTDTYIPFEVEVKAMMANFVTEFVLSCKT